MALLSYDNNNIKNKTLYMNHLCNCFLNIIILNMQKCRYLDFIYNFAVKIKNKLLCQYTVMITEK